LTGPLGVVFVPNLLCFSLSSPPLFGHQTIEASNHASSPQHVPNNDHYAPVQKPRLHVIVSLQALAHDAMRVRAVLLPRQPSNDPGGRMTPAISLKGTGIFHMPSRIEFIRTDRLDLERGID
jgi:hypothetical protein